MYKIRVKTLDNINQFLTYHKVESYKYEKGLIVFTDSKTKRIMRFAPSNCEIEEEVD